MAIKLPKTSPASVGTSRRPRTVRLATAGDVPTQEIARDPGLRVPDLSGGSRGLEVVGAGLADVGERLVAADARLNARRESVERMRAGRELHDFGNDLFTEFESSRDFSRQEDTEEFGAALNVKTQEILAAHQGSEESKLRLQEKLGPILKTLSDRAGVASVTAQDALVDREFDEIINGLVASVRQGENPRVAIANGMAFLEAERDSLRPGQEIAIDRKINSLVWGAKVDDFMSKGAIDDAERLLGDPEVSAALGPEAQKQAFNRIATVRREGKSRILTPGELSGMGFPQETIAAGIVVQKKADGSVNVVFNPPKDQDEGVRKQRIDALKDQFIRTGMEEQAATDKATNIIDGNIRFEITTDGFAREIDAIAGTVKEVPLGTGVATAPPPQEETLFEIVKRGNTAGIFPAAKALVGRTVGQAFEGAVDPQLVEDRQAINLALLGLIRSLAINPRFPVAEMERIREEIKIAPAVWDSPGALLARMEAIRKGLEIRRANEQNAADDPNLPQKTRASGAQAAKDIGNFLIRLGVPDSAAVPLSEGVPAGSTKLPFTLDGKDVWATPDGKRVVVE